METFKYSNQTHLFYVQIWMSVPMQYATLHWFCLFICSNGASFRKSEANVHFTWIILCAVLTTLLKKYLMLKCYVLALARAHNLLYNSINQALNLCYILSPGSHSDTHDGDGSCSNGAP